ncbi:hypothetical protein AS594_01490 [Streptomyces agglomeratus]|uniref:Uncharacterized protein n=1 Tax=Streptomyces agglomeratus TaxID=285458 RepID=A0A1E5P1E5_9ACTN|nr:hypothetical protein AS594_01490 [Streptomyces agglomeratus]
MTWLAPAKRWMDATLGEDQTAPRQRYTARRLHQGLAAGYGFDSATYSTICDYVQIRRPQIEAEIRRGRQHIEGMVPQAHLPGRRPGSTSPRLGTAMCRLWQGDPPGLRRH